jgi:hypothetical protein
MGLIDRKIPKVENLVLLLLKLKEVADIRQACHRRIIFGCDPDFYQRRHILLIYTYLISIKYLR